MPALRPLTTALAAAALALSAGAPARASGCSVPLADLGTGRAGVATPYGTPDDTWVVMSTPTSNVPESAHSTMRHPSWYPHLTAGWISPLAGIDTGQVDMSPGPYRYLATFYVPNPGLVQPVEFWAGVDDHVTFYVNGQYVGGMTGFASLRLFRIDRAQLVAGTNVLEAYVVNGPDLGPENPTGLLVDGVVCV